jgi:hypothetical protein
MRPLLSDLKYHISKHDESVPGGFSLRVEGPAREANHPSPLPRLECAEPHLHFPICFYGMVLNVRGRVSKEITNGSKTAVIDVIGFVCASLGSSTVQLHDSLGSSSLKASLSRFNIVSTAEYECGDGLQTEEHIFRDSKLYEDQGATMRDILSESSKKEYPKSVSYRALKDTGKKIYARCLLLHKQNS